MGLSAAERKAVTQAMAIRYARASKGGRGGMLDELSALTGWTRRHARRRLSGVALTGEAPTRTVRSRATVYDQEVMEAFRRIWAMVGGPCGKGLAPFLAEMVDVLERCGEIALTPEVRLKHCAISAATIDRALKPERGSLGGQGALWHQARLDAQRPDPHPHLQRMERERSSES